MQVSNDKNLKKFIDEAKKDKHELISLNVNDILGKSKKKKKNVYLVEHVVDGLQILSICTTMKKAKEMLGDSTGLITKMTLDEQYPEGIGVCHHEHINEPDDDFVDFSPSAEISRAIQMEEEENTTK